MAAFATPPPSSLSCRFVPRKCKHEQLFLDSYLRTNRTNHTKIMRCFPHCCPCHRKRSYCGSPLFVQLDQTQNAALSTDELLVFGRFRPLTVSYPPLRVGERVPLASIESSLQRDDPSSGEWVEAELSHSTQNSEDGSVSWVFEVNASARWYYPWGGAATIALRATEHVFEVLVFRRVDARQLQLLAEATSTKFRLMSFRRGVSTASSSDTDVKKETHKAASDDALAKMSPVMSKPPTRKRLRQADTDELQSKLSPKTKSAGCLPRAPSPTTTLVSQLPVRTSRPPSTVPLPLPSALSNLGALALWLHELPINSAGSRRLAEWEQVVIDACADICTRTRGGGRAVRRPLTSILSALRVSGSHSPLHDRQGAASPLDVIDATVRTLLHVFIDPDCATRVDPRKFSGDGDHLSTRDQFMATHASWLHSVEREASWFANSCASAKWPDLLATAGVLQHQRRHLTPSGGDCFGYRSFVAQRRECFAQQQLRHAETTRARQRRRLNGFSITSLVNAKAPVFSSDQRVWVCRSQEVAIEMDAMAMHHSLSLLALVQFWRNLSCLRLDYSPEVPTSQVSAQLSLASVFNLAVADDCFTRLTLDGRYRWFHCLPSGEATTGTTLMGYVVGDYIGRATSTGTVHVTTFLWPSEALPVTNAQVAYAWHWTIDTASLASGASTSISVIVEAASISRRGPSASFETMPIVEKLRCVGRWCHVGQVQLQYHAQ